MILPSVVVGDELLLLVLDDELLLLVVEDELLLLVLVPRPILALEPINVTGPDKVIV